MLLREHQSNIFSPSFYRKSNFATRKSLHQQKTANGEDNVSSNASVNYPFWLKGLIFISHGTSLMCYGSVAIALIMYGMTVYAPKQWTEKYHELRNLQKQERQFLFTDEVLKNNLGESAEKDNSGFINPDATKPPIFLPNTDVNPINLKPESSVTPKKVEQIYPIAY